MPSCGPINLYLYEPQQNPGRDCARVKTGLSPVPVIYYLQLYRSKAVLLLWLF